VAGAARVHDRGAGQRAGREEAARADHAGGERLDVLRRRGVVDGGGEQQPLDRVRGGRRRRTFALTERGRAALEAWLAEPETRFGEFRFPGMLKVFFGADPAGFADEQAAHHAGLADRFEAVRAAADRGEVEIPSRRRVVLETEIALHRWWEARWRELADGPLLD
jgi:DNA-binding PadR family transcriptional regulator